LKVLVDIRGTQRITDPKMRNILFMTGMDQKDRAPFLLNRNISSLSGAASNKKV